MCYYSYITTLEEYFDPSLITNISDSKSIIGGLDVKKNKLVYLTLLRGFKFIALIVVQKEAKHFF